MSRDLRIVSLLPSATEIVYALDLGDQLVGVSSDCDHPPEARRHPAVSVSSLAIDDQSSPGTIDDEVRKSMSAAEPIYRLDRDLICELRPDLILAQDLCRVCAVPSGHVTEALEKIGCTADVVSLDPNTLDDVLVGIEQVAAAADVASRGDQLVTGLRERVLAVRCKTRDLEPTATLALEWADPPFTGGHWVPEMVRIAGGREVLGIEGAPSRTCTWAEVAAAGADVIVFMPCGYGLGEAVEQARGLYDVPEFASIRAATQGRVWVVDGSSYFSRPGPRLVDGLDILAWILQPELFPEPPSGRVQRMPV